MEYKKPVIVLCIREDWKEQFEGMFRPKKNEFYLATHKVHKEYVSEPELVFIP
jgi:hypothetical protein